MSTFLNEVKKATTYIKKNDFPKLVKVIKKAAADSKYENFGWYNRVASLTDLEEIAETFGIELENVRKKGYVRPVINDTYSSAFFEKLTSVVAPFMTDGEICVKADGERIYVVYKAGKKVS